MRLLTKPAIIFWAIVPLTIGSFFLTSDSVLDPLLSWLFHNGLLAIGACFASVLLTIPLLLALLRWNWQIRFVDIVGICTAWNIACAAGFLSLWLVPPWLINGSPFVRGAELVATGTLLFASTLYVALYVWAPHVRTWRFALRWIGGLMFGSVVVGLLIGGAAQWLDELDLVLPVLFVIPGGTWFINVLVSTDSGAVVRRDDIRWLAWRTALVAAVLSVVGASWLVWTRTDAYQIRRIREVVLAEITEPSTSVAWVRLAAHIGLTIDAKAALSRVDGLPSPVTLEDVVDGTRLRASELRVRASHGCAMTGAERLDCLAMLLRDLQAQGRSAEASEALRELRRAWTELAAAALEARESDDRAVRTILATAAVAGDEATAVLMWNRELQRLPRMSPAARQQWTGNLTFIPRTAAIPNYGWLTAVLHVGENRDWQLQVPLRLYDGLIRADRCSDAIRWVRQAPLTRWYASVFRHKDDVRPSARCLTEWARLMPLQSAHDDEKARLMHDLAAAMARIVGPDEALAFANAVRLEPGEYGSAVVRALVADGRYDDALRQLPRFRTYDEFDRSRLRDEVYYAWITKGRFDGSLIERMRADKVYSDALYVLAAANLMARGDATHKAILDDLEWRLIDGNGYDDTHVDVAVAFARVNRCRKARLVLDRLRNGTTDHDDRIAEGYRAVHDICQ